MSLPREITPFVLRLSDGSAYPLRYALPRGRNIEYNIRLGQAAESDVAQLFGSATRRHTPLELDAYVYGESRIHAARLVSELDAALAQTAALAFAELTFPVLAAHRLSSGPADRPGYIGFRVALRFYGSQHEFTDSDGVPVALT